MTLAQIILGSIVLVLSVVAIISIGLQQGKSNGLGALAGGSDMDTFFGKNKGLDKNAKLAKITIVISILLVACILALDVIAILGK